MKKTSVSSIALSESLISKLETVLPDSSMKELEGDKNWAIGKLDFSDDFESVFKLSFADIPSLSILMMEVFTLFSFLYPSSSLEILNVRTLVWLPSIIESSTPSICIS